MSLPIKCDTRNISICIKIQITKYIYRSRRPNFKNVTMNRTKLSGQNSRNHPFQRSSHKPFLSFKFYLKNVDPMYCKLIAFGGKWFPPVFARL